MKKRIAIPFSGFYESDHDALVDLQIESMLADDSGDADQKFIDRFFRDFGYNQGFYSDYCNLYLNHFQQFIKDQTGYFFGLKVESLQSPKYYNFETDRLFATINLTAVKAIYWQTNKTILGNLVFDRHSHKSGFHSFYPGCLADWPDDVTEWDHNQLETLFLAWMETKEIEIPPAWDLLEDATGNGMIEGIIYRHCGEKCQAVIDQCWQKYHAA